MRRILTILATALLASTLLASAAEARGGGGGGHMGGFGSGMHMGGGFGGGMGHFGGGHAMHAFGPRYGGYGYAPSCYYPDEAPKAPPWPPYCG